MDPLATLVGALIAGAAAALQEAASNVVKDGYSALKRLLAARYHAVDLAPIEREPSAPDGRRALVEQLKQSGAPEDAELLAKAQALLEEVARTEPKLAEAVGVDVKNLTAGTVRIEDIVAARAGVRVRNATVAGDFVVSKVRAGNGLGKR